MFGPKGGIRFDSGERRLPGGARLGLAKAAVGNALKLKDEEALQSAYDAYAKRLANRRLVVPENAVAGVVEVAREQGTNVRKKAPEIIDNSFAENLEKSGFLRELWGEIPK